MSILGGTGSSEIVAQVHVVMCVHIAAHNVPTHCNRILLVILKCNLS